MGDGDYLEVDTDLLRTNAGYFDEVHGIALHAYNKLFSELQGYGAAWGHDHFGNGFAAKYVPSADDQMKGMKSLTEVFANIAEAVRGTADNYDAARRAAQGE